MEHLYKIIIGAILLICLSACGDKQGKQISAIIPLAESNPDSALKALSKIDQIRLSDRDMALYALVYTMAQNKSGIDVDNDSLLRYAYNWYNDKPSDSLYAKCEYYMGLFYSLNDSSEKALRCFDNSINAAKKQRDNYTQSMGLFQASRIIRDFNPKLALRYAKETIVLYNNVKNGSKTNKIYALLNLAESYSYMGSCSGNRQALNIAKQALNIAINEKDSLAISNSYQDLSYFYSLTSKKDSSLIMAKSSFSSRKFPEANTIISLAWAYCDVDSLLKVVDLIKTIHEKDYPQYGGSIYYLLQTIALKQHDYHKADVYKDSLVSALEQINAINAETKDRYYNQLINKEKSRTKEQYDSQKKTGIIICISVISLIFIILILRVSHYKKEQMQIQNEESQERKRLIIEHQKVQISTMRNFLLRKINIINKIESLESGNTKQVLLSNSDWEELEVFLNSSDNEFVVRLTNEFPLLTKKDIRFLMLIRIGLPYSTIAQIYSIETKSVKQKLFLIKDKLNLKGSQKSAKEFIETF